MNFTIFFGSFLSYLLLMVIIVCVAALGFCIGRVLRKNKDAKNNGGDDISESASTESGE